MRKNAHCKQYISLIGLNSHNKIRELLNFRIRIITFFLLPFLLQANTAFSFLAMQEQEVRGILLKAETKEPVAGATIYVKGTKTGTKSHQDGSFSIKANIGDVFILSCVGFETYEVKIAAFDLGEITLKPSASSLDEIQIIGYGQTIKRFSTGNISTIKAADIARQPVSNPLLALQGRVPGITIDQSSGYPGAGVVVQVQGLNSIANNVGSDPLYIIDGVPYPSRMIHSLKLILGNSGLRNKGPLSLDGISAGAGNPFSFINPADIESMDVLKDADATAIYGSRAANGAILITTKKGKPGLTRLDINVQNGWGKVGHKMELLNIKQYLEMRNEAFRNNRTRPTDLDYDLNGTWDTTRYTDWQKVLIGGTAHFTDVQANVSGGSENTQFLVGAGYHRETTVLPGDFSDVKGSFRFNLNNVSPNQKFRIQLSGTYLVDNNQLIDKELADVAVKLPPVAPHLYKSDGTLNWAPIPNGNSSWYNPLAFLARRYTVKTHNLISSAILSYRILPGLEVMSSFGYVDLRVKETSIEPSASVPPEQRTLGLRTASFTDDNVNTWVAEPQVSYKQGIGDGHLEVMLGSTFQKSNNSLEQQDGAGFANDLALDNISAATTIITLKAATVYKYNALFSRINFNWDNRYIINLTARRDGSSRFGSRNRFHNFGAIGLGWIFSNETFIKNNASFLSFGKFRTSYGTTGNDQIAEYQYLGLYQNITVPVPYQSATGLSLRNLPNPYLQWEETKKLNLGLDLGFLNNHILVNANYFRNRSSNQVLIFSVPIITGFESVNKNFEAIVQNDGWELSLNTTNLSSKNFTWVTNANFTLPRNKLLSFPEQAASNASQTLYIGEPITVGRIYHSLGVDPATGTYMVADKDGKPTSNPIPAMDRIVPVNPSIPKYYGGLLNSFRYKRFELDALLQFGELVRPVYWPYVAGSFLGGPSVSTSISNQGNQPVYVMDRWRKPGDVNPFPRFDTNSGSTSTSNAWASDAFYTDIRFIKLKNVSISWHLPDSWKKKCRLNNARFYVQGQNLLTITNYKGLDPETGMGTTNTVPLPPLRVITTGIQVTL